MRRRQFLQSGGALLGSAILPGWLARAVAGDGEPKQPLWLHVQAGGGWDPTMLFDPRPELSNLAFYISSVTSAKGHTFKYAELGSGASFSNDAGYSFGTFFENQKEQLLVINGIFTATAGHATGACLAASGRLQPGHPSLFAMIAKQGGEGMTMPLLPLAGAILTRLDWWLLPGFRIRNSWSSWRLPTITPTAIKLSTLRRKKTCFVRHKRPVWIG